MASAACSRAGVAPAAVADAVGQGGAHPRRGEGRHRGVVRVEGQGQGAPASRPQRPARPGPSARWWRRCPPPRSGRAGRGRGWSPPPRPGAPRGRRGRRSPRPSRRGPPSGPWGPSPAGGGAAGPGVGHVRQGPGDAPGEIGAGGVTQGAFRRGRIAASMWLVVVLPLVPVTTAIPPGTWARGGAGGPSQALRDQAGRAVPPPAPEGPRGPPGETGGQAPPHAQAGRPALPGTFR